MDALPRTEREQDHGVFFVTIDQAARLSMNRIAKRTQVSKFSFEFFPGVGIFENQSNGFPQGDFIAFVFKFLPEILKHFGVSRSRI
jgi:hypothetical protein